MHSNYLLFLEMEDQISSSPNSGFCSIDGSAWSEESGWTMYFEDFMASCSGSSLISDATSYVAWKPSESDGCRKLRLKKRKQRNFVDDDDPLGDTATSPFDSFKVTITLSMYYFFFMISIIVHFAELFMLKLGL